MTSASLNGTVQALLVALGMFASWTVGATAQTVPDQVGLGPVLANIKQTRTVRLGYRESSPPFSFLDQSGRPIGYSLELCGAIVEQIGQAVDEPSQDGDVVPKPGLKIDYVKVTAEDRISLVVSHKIDLECGSTTANSERSRQVAFSPLIFVAGTRLLVRKGSHIASVAGLKGKAVVVTLGTTNEAAMRAVDHKLGLGLKLTTASDHEESYQALAENKVDAFATDDILLYGLVARHKSADRFEIVGDYLSYEPYGIMYPKDEPGMKQIVERSFRTLAENHDLRPIYDKWFRARLPTGERLDVPMSAQLEDSFEALGAAISTGN